MDADLQRWVERELDGPIVHLRRNYSGGSRELWFAEVATDPDPLPVVIRVESGEGAFSGTEFSLTREAAAYRSLAATDVPMARLLAAAPDGNVLVLEHLPGTARTDPDAIADADALMTSFFTAVAELHRLEPGSLGLPGLAASASTDDHIRADLQAWRRLAERYDLLDEPLLAYAFAWAEENRPTDAERTVLVQGDTGPGNFLHDGTTVTGLVDWEMWHLGDPMDDIAWIDMRSGASGPFADTAHRDRLYQSATGVTVDPGRVRYHAVLVQLRCAVTTGTAIRRGGGAVGLTAYQAPHHRFLVQLGADLADAIGFEPTTIELPVDGGGGLSSDERDRARRGLLEDVMPTLTTAATRLRTRDAVLVLEHDDAWERFGSDLHRADADDLRTTLGPSATTNNLTETTTHRAGATGEPVVLDLLFRRAQRALVLWATPTAGGPAPVRPPTRPR